jgi:hypothetical protein
MARKATSKSLKDFQSGKGLTPEGERGLAAEPDIANACVRCGHSPTNHLERGCEVDSCGCDCFVYPTDPEAGPDGDGRLLDDSPARSRAINMIVPKMRAYNEVKTERVRLSNMETEARKLLFATMKAHNLMKFEHQGLTAEITVDEKVVVHPTGEGTLPGV